MTQIPDLRTVIGENGGTEWVSVFHRGDKVCMTGTDLTGTVLAYEWNYTKSAKVHWDYYTEEGEVSWIEPNYLALVHSPTLERYGR